MTPNNQTESAEKKNTIENLAKMARGQGYSFRADYYEKRRKKQHGNGMATVPVWKIEMAMTNSGCQFLQEDDESEPDFFFRVKKEFSEYLKRQ